MDIYTNGAYLVPSVLSDGRVAWVVSSFEDDTFKDGDEFETPNADDAGCIGGQNYHEHAETNADEFTKQLARLIRGQRDADWKKVVLERLASAAKFEELVEAVPAEKVGKAFIEIGEADGENALAYGDGELFVAPDGKVFAAVDFVEGVDELPNRAEEHGGSDG
jgi:hypothetical protein